MIWKLIVLSAIVLIVVCFLWVFSPGKESPGFSSMPFVLWSSLLATVLLVVLTYLGARFFPYKEK